MESTVSRALRELIPPPPIFGMFYAYTLITVFNSQNFDTHYFVNF